jgi:hypothetical protein
MGSDTNGTRFSIESDPIDLRESNKYLWNRPGPEDLKGRWQESPAPPVPFFQGPAVYRKSWIWWCFQWTRRSLSNRPASVQDRPEHWRHDFVPMARSSIE